MGHYVEVAYCSSSCILVFEQEQFVFQFQINYA